MSWDLLRLIGYGLLHVQEEVCQCQYRLCCDSIAAWIGILDSEKVNPINHCHFRYLF